MNREIKFRAWDTQAKCMLGGSGMQMIATTGELKCLPSVIAMQSTGLKDGKGSEIFEGDILRQRRNRWTRNGKIVYSDGVYWLRYETYQLELYIALNNDEVEVIGNIYENENPELLK